MYSCARVLCLFVPVILWDNVCDCRIMFFTFMGTCIQEATAEVGFVLRGIAVFVVSNCVTPLFACVHACMKHCVQLSRGGVSVTVVCGCVCCVAEFLVAAGDDDLAAPEGTWHDTHILQRVLFSLTYHPGA